MSIAIVLGNTMGMATHTRIEQVTEYDLADLKKQHPEAYDRAFQKYQDNVHQRGLSWGDELVESFKAALKATGYTARDWEINNMSGSSYLHVNSRDCDEFTGRRAWAWLENEVLGPLRIPWYGKRRWEVSKYGSAYRADMVPPCPFTGYCDDDEYIDTLRDEIRKGSTVREAVEELARTAGRIVEREWEDELSEDRFVDWVEGNEVRFLEDGRVA